MVRYGPSNSPSMCTNPEKKKKRKDNEWHFPLLFGSLIQRDIYTGKQCTEVAPIKVTGEGFYFLFFFQSGYHIVQAGLKLPI